MNKTSLTFYVPLDLKNRIEAAAKGDDRSSSSYLVRLLDKAVPHRDTVANQFEIDAIDRGQLDLVDTVNNCTCNTGTRGPCIVHSKAQPGAEAAIGAELEEHQASVLDDWDNADRVRARTKLRHASHKDAARNKTHTTKKKARHAK